LDRSTCFTENWVNEPIWKKRIEGWLDAQLIPGAAALMMRILLGYQGIRSRIPAQAAFAAQWL